MNAIMVFFVLAIIVGMANSMPNVQDSNDLNENIYLDNVSRENRPKRNVQSSELSPSLRENEGCVDTTQGNTDSDGDGCDYYAYFPAGCGYYDTTNFTANLMCCACSEPAPDPCDGKNCGDECTVGGGIAAAGLCDGDGQCSFVYDTRGCGCDDYFDGSCTDTSNCATDNWGDGCNEYAKNTNWCGNYNNDFFQSDQMCCACGGGAVADYPDN